MPEQMCDFRCWHAKGTTCRCFCAGENHGKGRDQSDPVVRELLKDPEINKYGFSMRAYARMEKRLASQQTNSVQD